ncbi:MAG TPA: RidA family protein [Candidatus Acidoferrales bacterium]|nr:RidA family protein [Candidatus Acidoferrales bacterium]
MSSTASSKRRSIYAKGASHSNPIPSASRIGNVILTGGIYGTDPATGKVPDAPEEQVRYVFANLRELLKEAGATPEDIVKLAFTVKSLSIREAINKEWTAMFPDPESRPARHVVQYDYLAGNQLLGCEAYLVLTS